MKVNLRRLVQQSFHYKISSLFFVLLSFFLISSIDAVVPPLLQDVTVDVEVSMSRLRLDRRTLQSSTRVALRNIGLNTFSTPIRAYVENISRNDVIVANPDGVENGLPYFEYPEAELFPGDLTSIKMWYFDNPNRASFNFDISVSAVVPSGNTSPIADAGPDQTNYWGETVNLNGSSSSDANGDPLTFSWSFISRPLDSTAVLSNADTMTPSFLIDVSGDYEIELIVNDGLIDSSPDSVTISTINSTPVANAGPDQTRYWGETVTLDGSGSSDVDGDTIAYS